MKLSARAFAVFVLTGLTFLLAACGDKKPPQMPAPQVSAVDVHETSVPITYEYPGRVAGYKETEVRAQVGGILLKRNFKEGSAVEAGQLLFKIDSGSFEAAVARQKAQLAQAQAAYTQSVGDAERAEALWQQKYQSTAYRDQTVAKRDANKALVEQAEAQLHQAEIDLSDTEVTAPISGVTTRENVSEGTLLTANYPNNLLTTITQTDPVYINFSYAGSDAQAMRAIMADMRSHNKNIDDLTVRIRFGDGHNYDKTGVVDFKSPSIDKDTGALGVRATVPNPDGVLVPGQFVRLIVQGLEMSNVIAIPEQALMQDNGSPYVYVISPQSEVEKRAVAVSRQLADRSWLLERGHEASAVSEDSFLPAGEAPAAAPQVFIGLRDGERVVTEGHFRIGAALAAMPKGMKLKVNLVTLDGKSAVPAAESPKK